MADIYRASIARVELDGDLVREHVGSLLATGDKLANRYGVEVYRGGKAVSIAGMALVGYFIRPETDTVVINGTVSGNTGYVDLPQSCYTQEGAFTLALKLSGGDVVQTVRIMDGRIALTQDGDLIDPGEVVPTLDDILGKIAACEAAASAANTAAAAANDAAVDVSAAADEISKTAAPAIIPTATGDGVVVVNDSAARPLAGLRIYGKTTQDGTPSPDNPVPLVSIGADDGSITVKARGKNLMDTGLDDVYKGYAESNADGSITVNNTTGNYVYSQTVWTRIPKGTYTVQAQYEATPGVEIYLQQDEGDYGTKLAADEARMLELVKTGRIRLLIKVGAGINTTIAVQLAGGKNVASVAPYKDGGTVTVSTPNGLPGIPAKRGGNYTDETGQQWYCDEVDIGRGVYVQRTAYKRMQNLIFYSTSTASNLTIGYMEGMYNGALRDTGMCDTLPILTPDGQWFSNDGCVAISSKGALVQIAGCTTIEALNTYLDAHVVNVLMALATPVETALSSEELAAYAAMMSQKPTTTVYNDVGAGMAVDYIADTQTYIDNKFSALAAAVLDE